MPYVVARDGHEIFVRTFGRGRLNCLLVHGFASDGRSWLLHLLPSFDRYRFWIPDLRGFGRSAAAPLRHDDPLTTFAEDLEDIIHSFGLRDVALAGISMGAFTSLRALELSGERHFRRYLHIDQGPIIRNRPDYRHGLLGERQDEFFAGLASALDRIDALGVHDYDSVPEPIRAALADVFGLFASCAAENLVLRTLTRALAHRESMIRSVMPAPGFAAHIGIMRAYLEKNYDMRETLSKLSLPMTILVGQASRMYPAPGQRMIADYAKHAVVREVPHAGHMIPMDAPIRFRRELQAFLDPPAGR